MAGTRKGQNRLSMANQFALIQYVKANYVAADLHDREFAEQATKDLGFQVTAGNIQGVRQEFEIQATKDKRLNETPALLIERIEDLEKRMKKVVDILSRLGEKI